MKRLRRLAFHAGVVVFLALAFMWLSRRSILGGVASILVDEDPLAPAQIIVASHSMSPATALEAALLYRDQVSAHIVITDWIQEPLADNIRRLGIPYLGTIALSQNILAKNRVPESAITILPDQADGTGSEVAAIAAFVERCHVSSLLVITARTHTARTKWLLQRTLSKPTRVLVRSPRFDQFAVDRWWREREQSREIVTEYLRWFNSMFLRDYWARSSPAPVQANLPACGDVTTARNSNAGL